MVFKRFFIIGMICLLLFFPLFSAASTFQVKQIRIQGLQQISEATVFHYLPVHIGQKLTPSLSNDTIDELYQTGFFSNVALYRRGDVLVIKVVERPVIGLLNIQGNKTIKTKKLSGALKKVGIIEGQFYDSSKLNQISKALQQQYQTMGYYTARVSTEVKKEPHNRVAIYINIKEGGIAKIKSIAFVGNHAFSHRKLLEQFQLTTTGIFTWFSHEDRYSEMKLDQDLQRLRNFYLDNGYYDFHVVKHDVQMTDNNQRVAIVITVSEGSLYHISGFDVTGKSADAQAIKPFINLKKGETFSRQAIVNINTAIANYFASRGYAFPEINTIPKADAKAHTIFLNFYVNPKQRMYVRRIQFKGNFITQDMVLRARLRQMEGGIYNLSNINESKRQLALLSYVSPDIKVLPKRIPGQPDQMDLDYHIKEQKSGKIGVQGGYSDTFGFLYGANIGMPNFLGSGRMVNIGFQNSQLQQYYGISYDNPLYTINGIDRSFKIFFSRINPDKVTNITGFSQDDLGLALDYGLPLSNELYVSAGGGFDRITVGNVSGSTAQQVADFVSDHPYAINQFKFTTGLTFNSLNRAILPNKGLLAKMSFTYGAPFLESSLNFIEMTLHGDWYVPITHGFILFPHTELGYGTGFGNTITLPFYYNFYAGGINSLPGFEPNSLGPVVLNRSGSAIGSPTGEAIGGNVEILGGLNLIFPNPFSKRLRTSVFVDGGNVFQTHSYGNTITESVSLNNMRYSSGLMVTWWTPLGWPVSVSLAKAFNTKRFDQTTIFGFSFGGSI